MHEKSDKTDEKTLSLLAVHVSLRQLACGPLITCGVPLPGYARNINSKRGRVRSRG